ncbi:unnamed protein product, partial [Brachionus calyciflorus]
KFISILGGIDLSNESKLCIFSENGMVEAIDFEDKTGCQFTGCNGFGNTDPRTQYSGDRQKSLLVIGKKFVENESMDFEKNNNNFQIECSQKIEQNDHVIEILNDEIIARKTEIYLKDEQIAQFIEKVKELEGELNSLEIKRQDEKACSEKALNTLKLEKISFENDILKKREETENLLRTLKQKDVQIEDLNSRITSKNEEIDQLKFNYNCSLQKNKDFLFNSCEKKSQAFSSDDETINQTPYSKSKDRSALHAFEESQIKEMFEKINGYKYIGLYKSKGRANGRPLFQGPNGGIFYVSESLSRQYISSYFL